MLLENCGSIKARLDTLATDELARLMYLTRYFESFHDPRPKPGEIVTPGGLTEGQLANIADYAAALRRSATAFTTGLGALKPGDPIPVTDPNKPDLSTVEGVQIVLTKLGYDPGLIDGEDGLRTRDAVQKFQADAGAVDGVAGAKTRAALAAALAKVPVS